MSRTRPPLIPMVDLTALEAGFRAEVETGFRQVLDSGRFILGANVAAFEREAAAYLGVAHAVSCASGTDALHLALRAVGVGPGAEAITTPFTFIATAEAICHAGAQPVFADIDPRTFTLDPDAAAAAVGPATRAIVPVHLFGQPAAMGALNALAERHGLPVVEDCAQCFGARWDERAAGSLGAAGCFSFYPSKNLGAFGDGGLVVTGSEAVAERVRTLRNHGSRAPGQHQVVGFNSRLDELQAVVLRARLRRIDAYNAARRAVAGHYEERLRDLPDLVLPREDRGGTHVYHQYTVLVPERDALAAALRRTGIECGVYYPIPLHRQPAFAADHAGRRLPAAERVAQCCLSLPIYPELTEAQVDAVTGVLRRALGGTRT